MELTKRNVLGIVGIPAVQHFLVDALCACSLYLLLGTWAVANMLSVFILYNVLAFLTQPLTGWLADRIANKHWLLLASMLLLTIGVALLIIPPLLGRGVGGEAVLLGLGNSLFHVWGGQQVAVRSQNDIRALGIFVSTGAFGLVVGMVFASWPLLRVLLLGYCFLSRYSFSRYEVGFSRYEVRGTRCENTSNSELTQKEGLSTSRTSYLVPRTSKKNTSKYLLLILILLFVAFRSSISTVFTGGLGTGETFVLLAGFIAMLGKAFGGFLCRWTGLWWGFAIMLAAVALSPLLGRGVGGEAGLFFINCTMPVTLYLANRLLPGREGLSFGLLAAALMPGYLVAQSSPLSTLLLPLLTTIVIELGVLWFLRERRAKVLWASVVINVLTNVPLNLIMLHLPHPTPIIYIVIGELSVVLVETLCYYALLRSWRQAAIYSVLCNAISFLTGLLVQMVYYLLTL
ncbi:MAG: hypothetical protein IJP46_01090 [Prevotella sp.]|nr:hypothetical protein [Prevotella sp.]